jgi:hypothetical protein
MEKRLADSICQPFVDWDAVGLATSGSAVEATASATVYFAAAGNYSAATFVAASNEATSFIATSDVATVPAASVVATSPSVEPGASADEDTVGEVARAPVSVGRTGIRIVRVIAIGAGGWASYVATNANPDSDPDLRLRVGKRQGQ